MRLLLFSLAVFGGLIAGCTRTPVPTGTVQVAKAVNQVANSVANELADVSVESPVNDSTEGLFAKPVRLKAGNTFIDTEVGHAAPYVADIDRDGKLDLLVGQFDGGKLKICKNVGSNEKPLYAPPKFFEAGGEIVTTAAS